MIIWQPIAKHDLESISRYISIDNPSAAKSVVSTIVHITIEQLSTFPNSGKIGRATDTRELIISKTPYIVVYRIRNERIDILAIQHSSRKWTERF
jgi:toxin ParE1/3/4